MTEQDYLIAWAIYAVAALGCIAVSFKLTGWMWRWLREPLRLIVAVVVLTPTVVDPTKEFFAPAVAITAMDMVLKVGNNAWRGVLDLVSYGVMAFAAYVVFALVRWPLERKWRRQKEENNERDARRKRHVSDDSIGMEADRGMNHEPVRPGMRVEPRL
jgi:predicted ferric reductase